MARNKVIPQNGATAATDQDDVAGYQTLNRGAGRYLDGLQLNRVTADWPHSDTEPFTRAFDHQYDVNQFGNVAPGVDVSPVNPRAGWTRGTLYRSAQPAFHLTDPVPMYDPTDPSQWRPGL